MQQRFKLILEGLDCANCALKIENGIKGIDGINNATVNFSNKTMMIESDWDKNAIIDMVREAVMKLEPGVTVLDKDGEEVQDTGIMKKDLQRRWIRLIFGIIPFIIALLVESTFPIKFTLFLVSYFAIGVDVLKKAVRLSY